MKHSRAAVLIALLSIATVAVSEQSSTRKDQTSPSAQIGQSIASQHDESSSPGETTPAESRIAAAKLQIGANPKKTQGYNDLALAFVQRAREAANPVYFRDAEEALATGIALAPNDFQLEKTHVALLLGEQRFAEAKKEAIALNHRTPDDVTTYGYIAEADIALGEYQDAETSAQWMLNLLPYNVPGLLLAARLRELYGDPEGALQCLDRAYTETSPNETEEMAWIANQMALIRIHSGNREAAVQALDRAEELFPQYPYTLENRAQLDLAQAKAVEAIALLRRLPQTPQVLYQLAEAEAAAGLSREAEVAYASFERAAKPLINAPANANRELILYYASRAAGSPAAAQQALDLARHEIGLRHDVWTLDAYSWALYVNGKYGEADLEIRKALAVGIRSDQIFNHAGQIATKLNQQADAARYFEAAVQLHSSTEFQGSTEYGSRKNAGSSESVQDAGKQPSGLPGVAEASPVTALPAASSPAAATNSSAAGGSLFLNDSVTDTDLHAVPAALLIPRPTETERIIRTMQRRVALNPKEAGAYSGLGAAFLQRARETGDVEDYQLAEQSLKKSLDLVSADLSATAPLATMAEVCMGEHRFEDALTYAQKALALGSGDLSPFAISGDAYADMGEYEKAGVAYSRLIANPDSQARTAYVRDSRLAYLKFISGDTDGAIRLMQSAVTAGVEVQLPSENLAWLYFELGEFYFQSGNTKAANHAYLTALTTHPGDYRALAGLGKVRANQGRYQEAILLYQKAIAVVPMPIYLAELGDVYTKAGDRAEAEKQYQLVEYIGLLGHINQVLHNRDLAVFYADHDRNLSESLALARKEFEVRHDVYTWDALAWALYKNGKYQEAKDAMDNALHFGTRDALLLFHAGMIEAKLGDADRAQESLKRALEVNPHFHVLFADQARQQLALFEKQRLQTAGGMNSHGPRDVQ
jgi:tetratricopeptide (TPR) repeat protein